MLQKEFSVLHDQELELYFLLDFNLWRNGCVCVGGGGGGGDILIGVGTISWGRMDLKIDCK